MFPWQLVITGAVGVGGTALGAWLNGRMQTKNLRLGLDAENERARLAEKRRIYAACISAANELIVAVSNYNMSREEKDRARTDADYNKVAEARNVFQNLVSEVTLIAPHDISNQAWKFRQVLMRYVISKAEDGIGETKKDSDNAGFLLGKLLATMRADLGGPD